MTAHEKATMFEAGKLRGEAFRINGYLHQEHVVEAIYDADYEIWNRRRWYGKVDGWKDDRPLLTVDGILRWAKKLGCTRVEVNVIYSFTMAAGGVV